MTVRAPKLEESLDWSMMQQWENGLSMTEAESLPLPSLHLRKRLCCQRHGLVWTRVGVGGGRDLPEAAPVSRAVMREHMK